MNNPTTASPVTRSAEVDYGDAIQLLQQSWHDNESVKLHPRHIKALLAQLEASQPKTGSTNYCVSCGFHTGASHDWKECEKARLELIFPKEASQPKPQSDEVPNDFEVLIDQLKAFDACQYDDAYYALQAVVKFVEDYAAALSQAPVPTTNGGKAHE